MNIGIAVFSGTGNTAHVAELLSRELRRRGATVEIHRIGPARSSAGRAAPCRFEPSRYDLVGIGHPILGFGPTPLVLRFARALPEGPGRMFVFKSAADNHRVNNGASAQLIRDLERKGYDVVHDFLYVMPCNWIFAYSRSFNLQILDRAEEKAARHAQELLSGGRSRMSVSPGWDRVARFFHSLESRYGRTQFGKALRATDACTRCGKCVRDCPASNISDKGGTLRFGTDCLWCMHCVYSCPAEAIDAQWMKWCVVKGGYRLSDYTGAADKDRTFISSRSRGYWRHFKAYFM